MSLASRRRLLFNNNSSDAPEEGWYSYAPVLTLNGIKWKSGVNGITQAEDTSCASIYTSAYAYPQKTFDIRNEPLKHVNFIPLQCASKFAIKTPADVYSQVILLNSESNALDTTIGEWKNGLNFFEKGNSVGFLVNYKHEDGSPFSKDWYTHDFDILCNLSRLNVQYDAEISRPYSIYTMCMNHNNEDGTFYRDHLIFYRIINGDIELLIHETVCWIGEKTSVYKYPINEHLTKMSTPVNGSSDYYILPITSSELATIVSNFPIFNIDDLV